MTSLFKPATDLMVMYAQYHRDRRNIRTHWVGIPLIVVAIGMGLSMLQWQVMGITITAAWLAWALSAVWYLTRGHRGLGAATVVLMTLLIGLAHVWVESLAQTTGALPVWAVALGVFVVGWVLQFVGHYFEGRKPAFTDDLIGLLVGPMFVVGEVLMRCGAWRDLDDHITLHAGPLR